MKCAEYIKFRMIKRSLLQEQRGLGRPVDRELDAISESPGFDTRCKTRTHRVHFDILFKLAEFIVLALRTMSSL